MYCPFCKASDTRVVDSRLVGEGSKVKRRRECSACGERFTTFEEAELNLPSVVKRDQTREPFDSHKLRAGMVKALEKRPVDSQAVEDALDQILSRIRASGEREIPAGRIGEEVMHALKDLDEVAYVRFASVYRQFKDLEAFREEIDRLRKEQSRKSVRSVSHGDARQPELPLEERGGGPRADD